MNYLKLLSVLFVFSMALTSCDKEGDILIEDVEPVVEVIDEEVGAGDITFGARMINISEANLYSFSQNEPIVSNYQIALQTEDFGLEGECE